MSDLMNITDFKAELDAIPGFSATFARMFPDEDAALAMAQARARRDMTQKEFAKLLGISERAVARIESGNFDRTRW